MDQRCLDPLLGLLLPGAGDVLSSLLGVYPVMLAWRRGASATLIARMLLNLAVDALGGSIPLVGDIWDFFFRAHTRNLALLESRLSESGAVRGRATDALVVGGAALALLTALALPIALVVVLVRAMIR
jgi:hypothetical protein